MSQTLCLGVGIEGKEQAMVSVTVEFTDQQPHCLFCLCTILFFTDYIESLMLENHFSHGKWKMILFNRQKILNFYEKGYTSTIPFIKYIYALGIHLGAEEKEMNKTRALH